MPVEKAAEKLILSVETATRGGSLAVLRGNEVCAVWRGAETFSPSAELLSEVQRVLEKAGVALKEIDLFAVALGPGSFTGLRVGIATVKGLSAALQTPICGVPTLEALAFGIKTDKIIYSIMPAGRSEVFAQIFQDSAAQSPILHFQLNNLLDELRFKTDVCFAAPPELKNQIIELSSDKNKPEFVGETDNLALRVGNNAAYLAEQGVQFNSPLAIIYGREPDFSQPNKAK